MKKQKGFIVPLLIILAVLITGGVYLYTRPGATVTPVAYNPATTTSAKTLSVAALREVNSQPKQTQPNSVPAGWKTYTNSKYGYSLAYPKDTKIDTSSDVSGRSVLFQPSISSGQFIAEAVKPSADCKDNAYGAEPTVKTIGGITFTVWPADKYFSVKTSATAREYCTVRNGIEYKLYTVMPYVGTLKDVDDDATLNNMVKSFRIE